VVRVQRRIEAGEAPRYGTPAVRRDDGEYRPQSAKTCDLTKSKLAVAGVCAPALLMDVAVVSDRGLRLTNIVLAGRS